MHATKNSPTVPYVAIGSTTLRLAHTTFRDALNRPRRVEKAASRLRLPPPSSASRLDTPPPVGTLTMVGKMCQPV
eukprot:3443991-Amphidinium_carterae.1